MSRLKVTVTVRSNKIQAEADGLHYKVNFNNDNHYQVSFDAYVLDNSRLRYSNLDSKEQYAVQRISDDEIIWVYYNQFSNFVIEEDGGGDEDASTLNGQTGSYYRNRANHTGTQPFSTISGVATDEQIPSLEISKIIGLQAELDNKITKGNIQRSDFGISNANSVISTSDTSSGWVSYTHSDTQTGNSIARRTSSGSLRVNTAVDNNDAVPLVQLNSIISAINAAGISYDNSESGLTAENTQAAIDEIMFQFNSLDWTAPNFATVDLPANADDGNIAFDTTESKLAVSINNVWTYLVNSTALLEALPTTIGTANQILKSNGTTITWQADTNTTYSAISQANIENPASTTPGLITGQRAAQAVAAHESIQSIVQGTNITIDTTDPRNPVINATGGGSSYTFTNGLTDASGTISLGGTLTEDTILTRGGVGLAMYSDSVQLQMGTDYRIGIDDISGILLTYSNGIDATSLIVNDFGVTIDDPVSSFGARYQENYASSGTANDRWIPDYGAVKNYLKTLPTYNAAVSQTLQHGTDGELEWVNN